MLTSAAVISNSIIHHIPDPSLCFAEMHRVCSGGGVLFVRDLLRPGDRATLAHLVNAYAAGANDHQRKMFADSLAPRWPWMRCANWWVGWVTTRPPSCSRPTATGRGRRRVPLRVAANLRAPLRVAANHWSRQSHRITSLPHWRPRCAPFSLRHLSVCSPHGGRRRTASCAALERRAPGVRGPEG